MTKLELDVRCTSTPSFSYLPTSNKTTTFDYPYIPDLYIRVITLGENKQKAQQEERKPNVPMTYFIPSY